MTREYSPGLPTFAVVWSLFLLFPIALSFLVARRGEELYGLGTAGPAWGVTVGSGAVALLSLLMAVRMCLGQRVGVLGLLTFALSALAYLSPAVARAVMPWEDPETGAGSPLATLFGILFLLVPAGIAYLVGVAMLAASDAYRAPIR